MVVAPTGASAASPGGGIGLRLVDVPASASVDTRARVYIVDHLAPGTVIHRRIEISNDTGSSADIALYPAAATLEGGSFLGAVGRTRNDVSSWTTVRPEALRIASGGREMADVEITVPSDAAPGERYGVVWAEARSTTGAEGGITQVSRVGIRLYLSVGPGGAPAADFTIGSIIGERAEDGRPKILATVSNVGGRALDMSGTLELSNGPGGLSAGPFPVSLGTTLAIGASGSVTIVLDRQLPAGPWDARITLRSGSIERSQRTSITFPAGSVTRGRPGWIYPAILGLAALLLLIISGVARRRRRVPASAWN